LWCAGQPECRYLADVGQANDVPHGWNMTGDTFVRDEEGRLSFVAHSDDIIDGGAAASRQFFNRAA
jgi:2-aminobenzoate-CoA ligase